MSDKWYGIDVSDNQGAIDWSKVKADGCQFAILRSVRRSGNADNQFDNNLLGCRAQGIPVAVYKYTYATTTAEAQTEAQQVVALLQAYALECQVWWDVEDSSLKSLGKSTLTSIIQAAQTIIEAAGYTFGIYAGQNVLKEAWFDQGAFKVPWWVARYPKSGTFSLMQTPFGSEPDATVELTGWQWTSSGKISGISGSVDMDVMYSDPGMVLETETGMTYFAEPKTYKNGSTKEIVYSSTKADQQIGSLDPYEVCKCVGTYQSMACVVYTINGSTAHKTGWVKWLAGIQD